MEKKRIIALGVDGDPIAVDPNPRQVWISTGLNKGVVLFGSNQRDETDAQNALELALKEITPNRRMWIRECSIDFIDNQPKIPWDDLFAKELRHLEPGEILVSPEIGRIYERRFLFERIKENEQEFYFLRGVRRRPERLRGLTAEYIPMIGRSRELSRLDELLEQIAVDQGQIAGIVGEAGIGKTRLTVALKETLEKKQIPCIEGFHSPGDTHEFEGFRQIVVGLVGAKIHTLSRWAMTDAETDFLRIFLDPGVKIERLANMSDLEIKQGLFYSVRKLVHTAAKAPLVLILEDLHWIDATSLELLEYVLEGIEDTRLLFVLVHRPTLEIRWGKRLNYNEIRLSPLHEDDIDRFVGSLLKVDKIDLKLRKELAHRSLGNALFVEELVRQFQEAGSLSVEVLSEGDKYLRFTDKTGKKIPTTLHALIASRFDQLEPILRDTLRWAALLGTTFDADELEALLETQKIDQPSEQLKTLFAKNYLSERSIFPRRIFHFSHDLIFETVLESIPDSEKKKKHSTIGHFLSDFYKAHPHEAIARIADHLILGEHDPETIEFALKAGDREKQAHQIQQAARFYRQAARIWTELKPQRIPASQVYTPLVKVLLIIGDPKKVESALEQWKAAGVGSTPIEFATFNRLESNFEVLLGHFEAAFKSSEKAMKIFRSSDQFKPELFDMMHDRIDILLSIGKQKQALHESLSTLREMDADSYRNERIRVWARTAFIIAATGDAEHAMEYLQKAHALIRTDTPEHIQAEVLSRTTNILHRTERFDESIQMHAQRIKIAESTGLRQNLVKAFLDRSVDKLEVGDYIGALQDSQKAYLLSREIHDYVNGIRATLCTCDIYVDMGATTAADHWFATNSESILSTKNKWNLSVFYSLRSDTLEMRGEHKESVRIRQRTMDIYKELDHKAALGRVLLNNISLEAVSGLRDIKDLRQDFLRFARENQKSNWPDIKIQMQAVAMTLASKGADLQDWFDTELQVQSPRAWLAQKLYVAKIRWLDSQNRTDEAKSLRTEYKAKREKMAERVPEEFRAEFLNHPLYKVPA
jgi:tetratricopeptide (TPR) repeat protein